MVSAREKSIDCGQVNVAFRTDASLLISAGHVMCCLTLDGAMRVEWLKCHFLCRDLGQHDRAIRQPGFTVYPLPAPGPGDAPAVGDPLHGACLGVTWQRDAAESRAGLEALTPVRWRWITMRSTEGERPRHCRPAPGARRPAHADRLSGRPAPSLRSLARPETRAQGRGLRRARARRLQPSDLTAPCVVATGIHHTTWEALGSVEYGRKSSKQGNVSFCRSRCFVKDLASGEVITADAVRGMRIDYIAEPKMPDAVIGRRVKAYTAANTPVCLDGLE